MDRDDYGLFAAIVEAGSLSAAARALKISPAMASKRLARLEHRLGAQLIRRTTRRLILTATGQAFYERVAAILVASREAEALVTGGADAPSGRLRVSAPTSFGRLHIAPNLQSFLQRYPQVELEIDLTDEIVDLLAKRVDVAIRIGPAPQGHLKSRRLAANRRLLCAAPAYLDRFGAPSDADALRRHDLLAATGQLPWRLEGPQGMIIIDGDSRVRTNSSEVVRELTLAGGGIALRSTWDVGDDLREGRLVRILPDFEGAADVAVHAVYPGTDLVQPSVRAFIDFLQALYAPSPPWDRSPSARLPAPLQAS